MYRNSHTLNNLLDVKNVPADKQILALIVTCFVYCLPRKVHCVTFWITINCQLRARPGPVYTIHRAVAMNWLCCFVILLEAILALDYSRAAVVLEQRERGLSFVQHTTCTYAYEVAVHTARGAHSTASDGFQLHALVSS